MSKKIKKYNLEDLLDTHENILKRCLAIEKISNSVSFIPNTQITLNGDFLKYEQDLIKKNITKT